MPAKGTPKKRCNINLDVGLFNELMEVSFKKGITFIEVCRQAFVLFLKVIEAQLAGAKLVLRESDGREREIWIL